MTIRLPVAVLAILIAMTFVVPVSLPVHAAYGKDLSVAVSQASFWGDGNMVRPQGRRPYLSASVP